MKTITLGVVLGADKKTPMTDGGKPPKPVMQKGCMVGCLAQTRVTNAEEAVRLMTLAQELQALTGNQWDIEQDTDFDLAERAVGANATSLPSIVHGSLVGLFVDAREAAKDAKAKRKT